ncbi:GNAT family N-acetyltransferase [Anaerococcus sp. Marseille-Q7828]|uniref:GNAT family N-acetyltransferase n=1 Tax=Anaerococcus sp. Marseille-Q7828 TaxID=3036300 RepID=UPI0024ACB93C|nr:GNAT family N-acetyltransferase [Anaerococcus sp. Marseille-Q7828]
MKIKIKEITDKNEKETIAREILYDLPEWFGLPESTEEYIRDSKDKDFFAGYVDEKVAGFIVLNPTSSDTAEIFVMGVKKEFHRLGLGTNLVKSYEKLAIERGYSYSQVKTVKSGRYVEYDITNNFYKSLGYVELECFPDMWDEWNPCQIYIKFIK